MAQVPLIPGDPPELLVYDAPLSCPYLEGRTARMPLRLPVRKLNRAQLETRLRAGERRQGRLVYLTDCPNCQACEAIRVPAADFRPSRTQRRVWRRGLREIEVEVGPVDADPRRVWLYNRHKELRELQSGSSLDLDGYQQLLADSPCESFELRYRVQGALIGVAVVDRAEDSLSAVYCCYDPDHGRLSPGVFSVLYQLDLCRSWGLQHLYLGLTVDGCRTMLYKQRYLPHERLVAGTWRRVERPPRVEPDGQ
jgi:arginine-tRNA-protein transferase